MSNQLFGEQGTLGSPLGQPPTISVSRGGPWSRLGTWMVSPQQWEEPRSFQQPAAGAGCNTNHRFGAESSCLGGWGEAVLLEFPR